MGWKAISKSNLRRSGIFLLFWWVSCAWGALATDEYEIKAALLFKLSKFVTWPGASSISEPMTLCVYGKSPFGSALQQLQRRVASKLPTEIRYFSTLDPELDQCHMLFISQAAASHVRRVVVAVSHSPVLTVSDIQQFADSGGMVEFSTQGQRIRFRINLQASKNADIRLASPLLELATIVSGASS